jgi:hypothetical protein
MLTCREVTRLVSKSMDSKLPWHQRLGMRIHLIYCVWCRRYAAQTRFLRKAASELVNENDALSAAQLSAEAKREIRARLQQALEKPPPPLQ